MQYPASTLNFQKNRYYVVVTIPEGLRAHFKGAKQLKLSTRTSDKRLAEQIKHQKTTELYAKLDVASQKQSPIYKALKRYIEAIGVGGLEILDGKNLNDPHILEDILFQFDRDKNIKMYSGSEREMHQAQLRIEPPYYEVAGILRDKLFAAEQLNEKKFSDASKSYLLNKSWGREKTKAAAEKAHKEFISAMGDLTLSKITKQTGYEYAKILSPNLANKTIKNRITFVAQALTYCEKEGWIESNPFLGLKLSEYGKKPKRYKPLTSTQLTQLFQQKLPDDVELLFACLVTTGMRLDEAASLHFEDIKSEDGIFFFDLSGEEKVLKNIGSARKVPIIPQLKVRIGTGSGRLFPRFRMDADGKAQAAASKACMPFIRNVTTDKSVVLHSLRGTLKDLLRNAGVHKEINDFITGHSSGDVAGAYGSGPSLKTRYEALCSVKHPWIENV